MRSESPPAWAFAAEEIEEDDGEESSLAALGSES